MADQHVPADPQAQMIMIEASIQYAYKFGPTLDVDRLKLLLNAWKAAEAAQTVGAVVDAVCIYGAFTAPKHRIEATFHEVFSRYCIEKHEKLEKASKKMKEIAPKDKKSIKEGHTEDEYWTIAEEVHSFARKLNSFSKFTMAGPATGDYFITIKLDTHNPRYRDDYDRLKEKYDIYYDVYIKPNPNLEQQQKKE